MWDGIYVGYRFWETAAAEGLINYDEAVVYPFGYGLSYTTFTQEMGEITETDGTISFDVTVTNTGDVAGKRRSRSILQSSVHKRRYRESNCEPGRIREDLRCLSRVLLR